VTQLRQQGADHPVALGITPQLDVVQRDRIRQAAQAAHLDAIAKQEDR
jgi:hypothetical protein